jgi:thiol-disulfide isomerase/thioredoxin
MIGWRRLATWGCVAAMITSIFLAYDESPRGIATATGSDRMASGFQLRTASGRTLALSSFSGRPIVIDFFASWCPPCRQEAPALAALMRRYGARVYAISVAEQDRSSAAAAFALRAGWTWPVALDPNRSVALSYGVVGLPTVFLLDTSHRIVGEFQGSSGIGQLSTELARVA